ncbi:macro domain-containing protein [Paenibacillus sp. FSL M7-0134]|uniref:macro domain-containing protein n=1 Tax=Paenibacillus sp. FSL M7-0134 TaxID=2954754 RepID=UPI0030F556C6
MKIKVNFFDKELLKGYGSILSIVSVIFSFIFIFVKISDSYKLFAGIVFFIFLLVLYIFLWLRANLLTRTQLLINNSIVNIRVGDIFNEIDLKVIAFNEYFDTQVDNKIVSDNTLNGKYINNVVRDCDSLDNLIETNNHLIDMIVESNVSRRDGKKSRYKLGTILEVDTYLLTAFSKFDNENRAYLSMEEYVNFLLNFWNEVDIVYCGRSISIPLFGSGITRMKGYDTITDQELLELLIWSFKVSRIKFTYPSVVSILIHESKKDKINFYKLKRAL